MGRVEAQKLSFEKTGTLESIILRNREMSISREFMVRCVSVNIRIISSEVIF